MLHDLLGIALIGVGSLSMVARVMARSTEFRRRPHPRPAASSDIPQQASRSCRRV